MLSGRARIRTWMLPKATAVFGTAAVIRIVPHALAAWVSIAIPAMSDQTATWAAVAEGA